MHISDSAHDGTPPIWYEWFYHLYWPAWLIGTALIIGSWINLIPQYIGWIGFTVACAAALLSYVLPTCAGIKTEDCVVLDTRLLQKRGDVYTDALNQFQNGATLMYDGVAFGFRPDNEIACGIIADSTPVDEKAATENADHATTVFNHLVDQCPEFAEAIEGRIFRISIMSSFGENAKEVCRIVDGKFDWQHE